MNVRDEIKAKVGKLRTVEAVNQRMRDIEDENLSE